jgi:hypothetical protein
MHLSCCDGAALSLNTGFFARRSEVTHEFKVVLDGIDLPPTEEKVIREAIQNVVMSHLARVDFGGDRTALILPLKGDGGQTQGIFGRPVDSAELERIVPGLKA